MCENLIYADLSRMLELPKCAVLCRTEDDVRALCENANPQLVGCFCFDLDDMLIFWSVYKEHTGFTLYVGDELPRSISYCNEQWFRDEGYELVEFSDLCNVADIEESDQSVDILLGGGA